MSILICGTFAYDTVMMLDDKFRRLIQSAQTPSPASAFFNIPDLRRQFGGSAGNIAYNLKMLGADPLPIAAVGMDFRAYAEWLDQHGICRDLITVIDHSYTAQTYITIDMDDNQMVAFHPGAMIFSHLYSRISSTTNARLGIISSDYGESMMMYALQYHEAGIPFLFNPGHSIEQFEGDELLKFIEQASWILLNQSEWAIMSKRTGLSEEQAAQRVNALILTNKEYGADIYADNSHHKISPATPLEISDTSGCSDAFCAGLLYGLDKDVDWDTTGCIASLMAAIKLEHHGTQNHKLTIDEFKARFQSQFGYALLM